MKLNSAGVVCKHCNQLNIIEPKKEEGVLGMMNFMLIVAFPLFFMLYCMIAIPIKICIGQLAKDSGQPQKGKSDCTRCKNPLI